MNDWSGSIIYEWIEETNNYGIVSYGAPVAATATGSGIVDGYTRTGTPLPVTPDFSNLKAQWATLTPTGVHKSDLDTATLTTRDCPSATSGWLVSGNVALPSIGQTLDVSSTGSAATSTSTSSSSSASGSSSGSSKSPAAQSSRVTVMGSGLVAVMLLFMVWL